MRSRFFLALPILATGLAIGLAIGLATGLTVAPAHSQSGPELRLPETLDRALRDMMERMKPTLDEFFETLEIFDQIDGLENYQPPEILPNGDIIIRRRDDAPLWQPPKVTEPDLRT